MKRYQVILDLVIEDNPNFDAKPADYRLREVERDAKRLLAPLPRLSGSSWHLVYAKEIP